MGAKSSDSSFHSRTTSLNNETQSIGSEKLEEGIISSRDNKDLLRFTHTTDKYAGLKRLVKKNGLLEKQPMYYTVMITIMLGLLALSLIFLVTIDNFWLQLLNAIYLAFVSAQLALLAHDAGHRQIFHKNWQNDIAGLIILNLLLGISFGWWQDKHNKQHR